MLAVRAPEKTAESGRYVISSVLREYFDEPDAVHPIATRGSGRQRDYIYLRIGALCLVLRNNAKEGDKKMTRFFSLQFLFNT